MARKGAVLGNFLFCDSQDIAGVDTVVRQAASVWILGVQRELNELKRTIQTIPAGIKRPKPEDVATLDVGPFLACWGRHAVKVYVLPAGASQLEAREVALGLRPRPVLPTPSAFEPIGAIPERALPGREALGRELEQFVGHGLAAQRAVDKAVAAATKGGSEEMNAEQEKKLDRLVASVGELAAALKKWASAGPPAAAPVRNGETPERHEYSAGESLDNEALYQAFKERLLNEAAEDPRVIEVLVRQPEIRVKVDRHTITVDGDSLRGRVARLIIEGYFDDARSPGNVQEELKARGFNAPASNVGKELAALARMGFFTKNNKWFRLVPSMKRSVLEA